MSSRTLRSLFPLSTLLRCPNPSRAARSLLAAAPHLPGRRLLAVSPSTSRRTPSEHGPRISNLRRSPRQILATPQREAAPNDGDVLVEVPDDPEGVLKGSQAELLLSNAALIVTRQIELLNVFAGFEQSNRYVITNEQGQTVGFVAEEDQGLMGSVSRQMLRTRRPFRAVVLDLEGQPILWVRRPFQVINSKIYIHAQAGRDAPLVGFAQQRFHPIRRKYELFLARRRGEGEGEIEFDQFASVDEPLLSWEFWLKDEDGMARGSVSRNFSGLGRELFTDTGSYVLRFDAVAAEVERIESGAAPAAPGSVEVVVPPSSPARGLTLDERAIALACALSCDIDYFSRHSGHGGMGMMMPFGWFGGGPDLSGASTPSSSGTPPPSSTVGDSESAQLPPNMRDDDLSDLDGPGSSGTGAAWEETSADDWQQAEGVPMDDPWGQAAGFGNEEEVWGEEDDGW